MKTEKVHTVVLGAGPSGLASAYLLAKAGHNPVVLERDKVSGGLMRSIRHGDFILDLGRKELYNRIARVDEFWAEILGDDYRTYTHRGGLLYDGKIIDMTSGYQGVRRGMPWGMVFGCFADFLRWRMMPGEPKNLEEYWYRQRGRLVTRVTNQGFQEKLVGKRWADVQLPAGTQAPQGAGFFQTVQQGLQRAFSAQETNTYKGIWRHPAKGTGQICESLDKGIRDFGGRVIHQAQVQKMTTADGRVQSITAQVGEDTIQFEPTYVVSSAPAEFLQQQLLSQRSDTRTTALKPPRKRVVILVYLMLNEEPRFPHFWLQVTCQKMQAGRIANFAALNCDMVPKGKTCLCLEYYCFGEHPLLALDDAQMTEVALKECAESGLITREKCFDTMVLRFPGADASQNRHNWFSKERQQIHSELRQFENLYSVNRTDLDIATLAGIESAEAILSGNRDLFDQHFSPTELGVRSAGKPFEFRNPAGVEI